MNKKNDQLDAKRAARPGKEQGEPIAKTQEPVFANKTEMLKDKFITGKGALLKAEEDHCFKRSMNNFGPYGSCTVLVSDGKILPYQKD